MHYCNQPHDNTTLQHITIFCKALQHTATHCNTTASPEPRHHSATCLTATHHNTPQRTATHCNTLQHTATHLRARSRGKKEEFAPLQLTTIHCNTLQHTAAHRNTPESPQPRHHSGTCPIPAHLSIPLCANSATNLAHSQRLVALKYQYAVRCCSVLYCVAMC